MPEPTMSERIRAAAQKVLEKSRSGANEVVDQLAYRARAATKGLGAPIPSKEERNPTAPTPSQGAQNTRGQVILPSKANEGGSNAGTVHRAVESLRSLQEPVDSAARSAYWAPGLHSVFKAAGVEAPPESPQRQAQDAQLQDQQRMIDALEYQKNQQAIEAIKRKLQDNN